MTTPHARLRERLAYYRDLASDERREVDLHLAGCLECQAALEAYQRQDGALKSIPTLRPGRQLFPQLLEWPRRAFALLGEALTLGGLAGLVGLLALQLQASGASGLEGGVSASKVVLEPGVAIPPTSLRLPSPWLPALPWVAAALLFVGLLFILSRRSRFAAAAGLLASAVLLTSFVPPFSALPNPAAFYWRAFGGYGYDPRLPFKNSFLIAGAPERQIRPYLDRLIGQVGLTPLDPVQPLARYEILRVGLHPHKNRTALVVTRFVYADGSSRVYPVPLLGPAVDLGGFLLSGWRADGLQRLRSEHLPLPGEPFAGEGSPIRLGPARRLELHPAANRLDEANPAHWLWSSVRVQRLVWSPDGAAFLAAMEVDSGLRQLWVVRLDGSAPVAIGEPVDIREYGWSPDGEAVVYTRLDPDAQAVDPLRPFAIEAARPVSRAEHSVLATGLADDQLPGLTSEGAWFVSGNSVWLAPFDGRPAELVISDAGGVGLRGAPRPSPDGSRLAMACLPGLCLFDRQGKEMARASGMRVAELRWSFDGSRLAAIDRDPNNLRAVRLTILSAEGEELLAKEIAPRDATDPPQWTPDGRAVFVQTFPQDGRRIIALDIASGQVLDLSQEHWDAYFALAPDGRTLLLNNGRGDFWLAEVIRD